MAKSEKLKKEVKTVSQLKEMTHVLEETAARDISLMRERIIEGRPYFQEAWKIYRIMQQLTPPAPDVLNKHLVVAVTLEWGMTGSLLTHVLDKTEELYKRYEADILLTGNMGRDRFADRDERTVHFFNVPRKSTYEDIAELNKVVAKYMHIHFVYPRFESLSKQVVTVSSVSTVHDNDPKETTIDAKRFTVEPDINSIVNYMNEVVIGLTVYSYFSEALLAYSAAQMVAMRAASDNAKDELRRLNIKYNKARREQIDAKLRELYESRPCRQGCRRHPRRLFSDTHTAHRKRVIYTQ